MRLLGGAAAAWPFAALAEQSKVARIGVLLLGYPDPSIFMMGLRADQEVGGSNPPSCTSAASS